MYPNYSSKPTFSNEERCMLSSMAFLIEAFKEAGGRFPSLLESNITLAEFLKICNANSIVLQANYKP